MVQSMVQAAQWTVKEGFVFPNEFIYWSIQIVMYPFTTGLVAGAFVLSSLYHVFGIEDLKDLAKFSLVFSFALLVAAPLPLLFHLEQPQRGIQIFFTPHFTSAIAAFGIVFFSYAIIVCSEIWFVYRKFFVEEAITYRKKEGFISRFKWLLYTVLTLGAFDISKEAINKDKKIIKWLAGIGIPVACFLHGYAGFIFGSVKANALWMTPLMPVIFIMSAIVSGIALCMLTYILIMEIKKMKILMMKKPGEVLTPQNLKGVEMDMISKTTKYLIGFMIAAMTLEILDLIFRGYTAVKTWDILRSVIYGKDAVNIFFLQYTVGNLIPFIILLLPKPNVPRMIFALSLVLFGVFMMRWNVVIGGQSFSLTFAGYMHYHMPIIPHNLDTFKEGLGGALISGFASFVFFWVINKFVPSIETAE